MQDRESHAKPLPLRRRHRHYSAGDALMIRYLLPLFFLFCLFSCPASTCLVKGTKILTHQGSKLIETLVVGDKIISYNGTNKVTNEITAIKKSKAKKTLKITLKNGITIEGTKEHPVFNVEKQSYVKLSKLKQGDSLQLINGGSNEIVLIEKKKHPTSIDVYDLSVKPPFHNYFAEGVLVHNKSPIFDPSPYIPLFFLIIALNDSSIRTIRFPIDINNVSDIFFTNNVIYFSNNVNLRGIILESSISISVNLSNANLSNANLSNASLYYVNLQNANLQNAYLQNTSLQYTDLRNANLREANLSDANLLRANLSNANLSNANLYSAILSGANLSRAELWGANLSKTELWGANLSYANLSYANLTNTTFHNTRTNGIILTGAVGIDSNTFIGARP